MHEDRMLERIGNLEREPAERGRRDIAFVLQSITGHLRRILNTHRGSALIAEDYGMPELTQLQGEDVTGFRERIAAAIRGTIQKYEPRLENVRVSFAPEMEKDLTLRFRLEAEVAKIWDQRIPVELVTVIRWDGVAEISDAGQGG